MSASSVPTFVDRVDDRLMRSLSTPWPWTGTMLVLLVGVVAEIGIDSGLVMSLAMVVPVAFVGRFSRAGALVALAGAMGWLAPQEQPIPVAAGAGLVVVCCVVAYRVTAIEVCVLGLFFVVNAVVPFNGSDAGAASYLLLAVVAAALGAGRLLRSRSDVAAERDALSSAHTAAVRENLLLAERTAIARELHDIVAHHISAIAIQAETARYTTPELPDIADEKLAAIGDSARAALDEMRRLLVVMRSRSHDTATIDRVSSLAPSPGLDQLPSLLDATRRLGTTVELVVRGGAVPIPVGTDLVAYRVVQEALTNARRHAPDAAVSISLDHVPTRLRVTISDDGQGVSGPVGGAGLGLIGMRERVDIVGGTLRHGPRPDGGFEVVAELPLQLES